MNIITYASPVAISPKRLWSIGLYKKTQTFANWQVERAGVLQLLSPAQDRLVPILGGLSAASSPSKPAACATCGFPWNVTTPLPPPPSPSPPPLLPDCVSYVSLKQVGEAVEAGDHQVVLCEVVESWGKSGGEHLTTGVCRAKGLITEQGRVAEGALAQAQGGGEAGGSLSEMLGLEKEEASPSEMQLLGFDAGQPPTEEETRALDQNERLKGSLRASRQFKMTNDARFTWLSFSLLAGGYL
jgi:hypothetical protein